MLYVCADGNPQKKIIVCNQCKIALDCVNFIISGVCVYTNNQIKKLYFIFISEKLLTLKYVPFIIIMILREKQNVMYALKTNY